MVTNFFQALESLGADISWTIRVEKGNGDQRTVSVLPMNDKVGDDARKLIMPMVFKGTPIELDNGIFTSMQMPVKKVTELFFNMEAHLKSIDEAKQRSRMEQEKINKEKKEKEKEKSETKKAAEEQKVQKNEKKSRYEAMMKTVADLEAEKKYKEAIAALPDGTEFSEYASEINKRSLELLQKNINPGLF